MTRVLITGVRGKTGAPLAHLLAAHEDVEVLGGSSDVASVATPGVVPTVFSWDEPAGWSSATSGVDALFLVRPDRLDAPELVAQLLATTPPEARVVLLSERAVDAFAPEEWAPRVEEVVRTSGRPWTLLRPSWFMQVFTDPRFHRDEVEQQGRLGFASGGATVAWIDARDIAAVAAAALLEPGHLEQAYELSGPEAMTLPRTAEVLSVAFGRDVEHVEVPIEDAVADLPAGFERDEYVWTLERVRDGIFSGVTDTVERVTGRAPRALADLLAP